MTGFVDSTVKDIDGRLKELQEEVSKLGGRPRSSGRPGSQRTRDVHRGPPLPRLLPRNRQLVVAAGPVGPAGAVAVTLGQTRRLELIRSQPGITIPQIAESLKIEPNYLYRVMPKLINEGLVSREGLALLTSSATVASIRDARTH
jgi:hypothetical protein